MTWTKIAAIGLAISTLLILWKTHQIWSAAFLGLLLAVSLNGPAEWLCRKTRMPGWLSTAIVLAVILGVLVGTAWAIGSPLASQVEEMSEKLPNATRRAFTWLDKYPWGQELLRQTEELSGLPQPTPPEVGSSDAHSAKQKEKDNTETTGINTDVADANKDLKSNEKNALDEALSLIETLKEGEQPSGIASSDGGEAVGQDYMQVIRYLARLLAVTLETGMLLVVTVVVMVFLAFDPEIYKRGTLWLVPKRHEATAIDLIDHMRIAMRWWMIGRLVSMTAVGVLTFLGMWFIGMPAPLALGAIAGVLSFVPNIGPIVAAVPGILLALGTDSWMVIWVICIYMGAQFIESNAITPVVERYAVSVPPGLVLVNQLVFVTLAGVWGMIISTPFLVVVMVLVQKLYVNQVLNKPIEVTGTK